MATKHYVTKSKLLEAIADSKVKGRVSEELGKLLYLMCVRYAKKPNFNNYSYKDDMIAYALLNLMQHALRFDPDKYEVPNPFSYYTTCIHHSFVQFLGQEKKQRTLKDDLMVMSGYNPSWSYADVEVET